MDGAAIHWEDTAGYDQVLKTEWKRPHSFSQNDEEAEENPNPYFDTILNTSLVFFS